MAAGSGEDRGTDSMRPEHYRHPPAAPRRADWLRVDALHELHYAEWGPADGIPVVEIHGGPGVGTVDEFVRLYDPVRWRVITYDQRGAGRSRPAGELRDNTTQHLVADLEALRVRLNIERWVLSGWSWGTTLALAYAQAHPHRVLAFMLRGLWTARAHEAEWFAQGLQKFFPDTIERRFAGALEGAPEDAVHELFRVALDDTAAPAERERAAADYARYELYACYLEASEQQVAADMGAGAQLPAARISAHYWQHAWFLRPDQLWSELPRITHLPCVLVHGRYDVVTVPGTSYELHRAWPGSELRIVERAGHMSSDPENARAITAALERLAERLRPAR